MIKSFPGSGLVINLELLREGSLGLSSKEIDFITGLEIDAQYGNSFKYNGNDVVLSYVGISVLDCCLGAISLMDPFDHIGVCLSILKKIHPKEWESIEGFFCTNKWFVENIKYKD